MTDDKKLWPEDMAEKVWSKGDITFAIVKHPAAGHYCGYAIFPEDAKPWEGSGYLDVDVHGGITYDARRTDGKMVYGFDCNHYMDEGNALLRSIDWLTGECETLADGINTLIRQREQFTTEEQVKEKLYAMAKQINEDDPLAVAEWTDRLIGASSFLIGMDELKEKYGFSVGQIQRALDMMQGTYELPEVPK